MTIAIDNSLIRKGEGIEDFGRATPGSGLSAIYPSLRVRRPQPRRQRRAARGVAELGSAEILAVADRASSLG